MRLHCNKCGKSVSTEVPNGTVLRGWIECPECIEKQTAVTFNDIANEICRDLPEGFTVSLELEQGAGWVELTDGEGNNIPLDNNDMPLLEQMKYALQKAVVL